MDSQQLQMNLFDTDVSMTQSNDIQKKINSLRIELEQHNYNYYVLNQPTISDREFDAKMCELQALENEYPTFFDANSPTQRVGSDLTKEFVQVKHQYPMLSLANTYSENDISEWYERVRKGLNDSFEVVCELKYDGTSISLVYENGQLSRAITRGDGTYGDDVTANIRTIRSIPLKLQNNYPQKFEIRGEILMPWAIFDKLNAEREAQEEPLFANPRNAASGTLKLQNPAIVAERQLDAFLYYVLGENLPSHLHYDNLQAARQWGFKISDAIKVCRSVDEIMDFINFWDIERKKLPVTTDGIVLKVNDITQQKTLGFTAKSPRWAIAYKFQAEQARTRLNSITYQVGRTGAITPVANLDPVQLSGTIVKRATLHNADIIAQLDLHHGDWVYVEKGGEIIPKIVAVDVNARQAAQTKIEFINRCPECGATLIRYEGEAAHYCPNENGCPPQQKGKIEHFVSRKAMNIEGLGSETIALLYQNNLLNNIADIYQLKVTDIARLERLGNKSAINIRESIGKSRTVPFERVLFALGIRFVGEITAKKLATTFRSINNLALATMEELLAIEDVGEQIAQSVQNYFAQDENKNIVEKLRNFGLQMAISEDKLAAQTNKLKGLTFVISGTFKQHSREEYKAIIEQNGGKNASSVSSKTNYILAGDNMGPSKLEKAKQLNINIITEGEFLAMCQ